MKTLIMALGLLSAVFLAVAGNSAELLPLPREYREPLPMPLEVSTAAEPALAVSGPHSHANLAIFLLHGKDQVDTRKIVTLAEFFQPNNYTIIASRSTDSALKASS